MPMAVAEDTEDGVELPLKGLGWHHVLVEVISTDGLKRLVSVGVLALHLQRTEDRKHFCYLVQGAGPIDVGHLRTAGNEVMQLVWREMPEDTEGYGAVIYLPNSTLVQGRNRLFSEVATRFPRTEFEYLIFMDEDAELKETLNFGMNTGNAWRTFERYLLEWRPAVGVPSYDYYFHVDTKEEVQTIFNFDQIVVAYHWETWPVLLPYTELFDDQSWWYCGSVQNVLCFAFFNNHRLMFNAVRVHRGTPFQIPTGWIASALTNVSVLAELPLEEPS
eukprot:CAMPEP_0177695580 /NCGR_PEP_ID=MMETSP0484_2-20121128/3531_1 /TAXON_ID=354590 /ORGANISM="Rhodomonas lens, Strain RHODO" /LENGTH=274 /DNA_ID=CAMNT_0019206511 /DNA_START=21 /DNA_END=841 /DNA_ORIENTATION=-